MPGPIPSPTSPSQLLRKHGLRATQARRLLIEALREADHPTATALHEATADHGIVLTTVYRTLETLEEAGLVWAVHVPGLGRTYHLGAQHAHHPHALCRQCGRLADLAPLDPDDLGSSRVPEGFAVEHVQLTVIGLCARCRGIA